LIKSVLHAPIESILAHAWTRIDPALKAGLVAAISVSLLAFGFEMTNLTLHHDDLNHLLVQRPLVGYYLGRFGHAWLFYYGQQGYFLPFLDMTIGIIVMALYGVLVARFLGARKAMDIAVVATVVSVFPYMAHIYQYNSTMIAYPLAHLLAASAVVLSTQRRAVSVMLAACLYVVAFSIYQAVLAHAATLFVLWVLSKVLFPEEPSPRLRATLFSTATSLSAVVAGGVIYVAIVASMNIPFDTSQGADQAFSLNHHVHNPLTALYALPEVVRATRSFLFWPESYFPDGLKKLQLVLVGSAALCCLIHPRGPVAKLTALVLFAVALITPRTMQLIHPGGSYHSLTLTAYALVIAGSTLIVARCGRMWARNASGVIALVLIAGYVIQCNWISTVNVLNTMAHYSTLTQVLARLRALPETGWDGKTVAVVGSYDMPSSFPFKSATGVATEFLDPRHMDQLARLLRDEARFVAADDTMPKVLEFAATHPRWPAPESVGVVDGMGVVVLSKNEP
jgi:hypothetical protein